MPTFPKSRITSIALLAALGAVSAFGQTGGGYGGPSILSRGANKPGQRGRAPIDLTLYGSLRGLAESNLTSGVVATDGALSTGTAYGVQAEVGAYGAHSWRRASVGLDYRGDYRKYNRQSTFDGTNQVLSLDFSAQPDRRSTFYGTVTAGTTNRAFGGFVAPAFGNLDRPGIPLNELFDSRVYFGQAGGGYAYRLSARTTLSASGDLFFIRRAVTSLAGLRGYRGIGQLQHRITRRDTVGAVYTYTHYDFRRVFGGANISSFGGSYRRQVTRNFDVELIVGVFRASTTGTELITLAPEIAAILGRNTGIEAFSRVLYKPQTQVNLVYTLERSSLTGSYSSGASPGNGVYLTSHQQVFSAGYSYTGIRKLSLGASAGYTRFEALGQNVSQYKATQGGGGFSYQLAPHVSLTGQVDTRRYTVPTFNVRNGFMASLGVAWSPNSLPVSIW